MRLLEALVLSVSYQAQMANTNLGLLLDGRGGQFYFNDVNNLILSTIQQIPLKWQKLDSVPQAIIIHNPYFRPLTLHKEWPEEQNVD